MMKLTILLLLGVLLAPIASPATTILVLPGDYSVKDSKAPANTTWTNETFHGSNVTVLSNPSGGLVLVYAGNATQNETFAAWIPADPVPPVIPDYTANFSKQYALLLGLGDIMQAQEYPEPYNDTQLRAFIQGETGKTIAAADKAARPSDVSLTVEAQVSWLDWVVLAAVAVLIALAVADIMANREPRRQEAPQRGSEDVFVDIEEE